MANSRSLVTPTSSPLLEKALREKLQRRNDIGGGLGQLEPLAIRLGLMHNTLKPGLHDPQLLVFAADHGLAVDGIADPRVQPTHDTVESLLTRKLPLTAFAGALFGIDVTVFQVRVSYDQKPYRRALMETYGARCIASPSNETNSGRAILAQNPNHPGSLGIAISEAVEVTATNDDTKYALGSVLNHVLMHQTIIGQEAMLQLEMAGDDPDVVVGCTGGGSNFAGISFPFIGQQLRGKGKTKQRRIVAVEPAACPSLTRGKYAYDFGDTGKMTPLTKMHTLGSAFVPPGFHAGGLRYHGMAPLVSHVKELGLIEAKAYHQRACFDAGVLFARAEKE